MSVKVKDFLRLRNLYAVVKIASPPILVIPLRGLKVRISIWPIPPNLAESASIQRNQPECRGIGQRPLKELHQK
jgi:hypothetical protein